MTVRVGPPPDNIENTHHVKLSKAGTDVGLILSDLQGNEDELQIFPEPNPRTPLRTASGETEYGDINPHLTSLAQKEFSAGRGYRDFDDQRSGYVEAHQIDTTREGKVLPAGQYFYAKGVRNWDGHFPRHNGSGGEVDYKWYGYAYTPHSSNYAVKFVASGTYDVEFLEAIVCRTVLMGHVIRLRDDNAGEPGTIQAYAVINVSDIDDLQYATHVRKAVTPYGIVAGNTYWIEIMCSMGNVLFEDNDSIGNAKARTDDAGAWASTDLHLICRATAADKPFKAFFQNYKNCLYTVLSYFDNSAPKVFDNGYHGVALATSTSTQIDVSGTPFVLSEHKGAICYLWGGTGADQYRPWRKIVDNVEKEYITNGSFAADSDWDKGTGWTIASNVASCDGTQVGNSDLDQDDVLTDGVEYSVTFTISNYVAGSIKPYAGTGGGGTARSANGTFTESLVCDGSIDFILRADVDFQGDIDDVSVITSALTFTGDPWDITPDITTVITIMASEKFNEIEGHGLTTLPSDFLSTHQCMYLAMGQGVNIKRLVCYNNSGTWTQTYADDGTNKADLLFPITSAGYTEIWRASRADAKVAAATAQDGSGGSPSNLTFNTPADVVIGSTDTKINSLGVYGDTPHLWVFKEDIPYEIVNDVPYEFRSAQMKAMRDWHNGKANMQFNRNLYWGFREGCERWSDSGDLLHMGPDVRGPEGMPESQRGYFADFAEFGGLLIGAYDGGDNNYSSILAWNGEGWHELFRAPWKGARILSLETEAIEGNAVDRLWFGCGSDVMCIPISENPERHSEEDYNFYPFIWSGEIETGYIYYNLREVLKYFDVVTINMEKMNASVDTLIGIYYMKDEDTSWTVLSGTFTTSPIDSIDFSADKDLTAERLKMRFYWANESNRYVGRMMGWIVNLGLSLDQKYIYRMRFRIKDRDEDLLGTADDYAVGSDKLAQIRTWANEKSPVLMNTYATETDDKYGFIEYPSIRVVARVKDKGQITRVCEMLVKEI